jgi:hypothetical protein
MKLKLFGYVLSVSKQKRNVPLVVDPVTMEFVPFDEPNEDKKERRARAEANDLMRIIMDDGPELDFDEDGRRMAK